MPPTPEPQGIFASLHLQAIVLDGCEAILPYSSLLEQVAERFGQNGAMNWLEYFLSGPSIRFKSPQLVLLLAPGASADGLVPDAIVGAALFSEYVLFGWKTGAVVTEDISGFRSVLARPQDRSEVAERCASEVLNRGAQIVLVTFAGEPAVGQVPVTTVEALWAARTRSIGSHLDLLPTFAATLARFDKNVRFRLGYFRRRLLLTTPCTFVPDAMAELTEERFLALNRGCLNTVPDEEAAMRWRACRLPGGYALGLRTDDGRWLGLIGGWRQGDTTVLHWQQNSAGWEKHSLTTVMRSYFLEHETERGTRRVVFFGGTPHSIRHYFPKGNVTDLMFRRSTLRSRLLYGVAMRFAYMRGTARRPNFLADTLSDATLRWAATARVTRKRGTPLMFPKIADPLKIADPGKREFEAARSYVGDRDRRARRR